MAKAGGCYEKSKGKRQKSKGKNRRPKPGAAMRNQKAKGKNGKAKWEGKSQEMRGFDFCLLIFAFCLLPFSASTAADEILRDPTRPPAMLSAPQEGGETVDAGPVLQSVLIASGRRTAVIGGRSVKVGDRVGDGRVVRINETEVVLKTGSGLQTLKLFPDVEKRTAVQTRRRER